MVRLKRHIRKNRLLYRLVMVFCLLAFGFVLLTSILEKQLGIAYVDFEYKDFISVLTLSFLGKYVFMFFISLLTIGYLSRKFSLLNSIPLHCLFALLFACYSSFLLILLENWFLGFEDVLTASYLLERSVRGAAFNFFLYSSIIVLVYMGLYMERQQSQAIREERLMGQLLTAKMSALMAQMNPHFLFNALNNISSMVVKQPKKSRDAISDLSNLLRLTLSIRKEKLIPLGKEIDIAERYLKLMKLRYDSKLRYSIQCKQQLKIIQIPPLLLQPMLENAVKYGFSDHHENLSISVGITMEDNRLRLCINNDGKPLEREHVVFGTGISNVLMRLQELYGNSYLFELKNSDKEVSAVLELPISDY